MKPQRRLTQHLRGEGSRLIRFWIAELALLDLRPIFRVLEESDCLAGARQAERGRIAEARSRGEWLLNLRAGGGIGPSTRGSLAERFQGKYEVERATGCWIWTAGVSPEGYGRIAGGGRGKPPLYAHRVSWELHKGPIPLRQTIAQTCGNRLCVNPDHLYHRTEQTKVREMIAGGRGRGQFVKGQVPANAGRLDPALRLIHGARRRMTMITCDWCSSEAEIRADQAARSGPKFCGRICANRHAGALRTARVKQVA